jgi:hypothetical protein
VDRVEAGEQRLRAAIERLHFLLAEMLKKTNAAFM